MVCCFTANGCDIIVSTSYTSTNQTINNIIEFIHLDMLPYSMGTRDYFVKMSVHTSNSEWIYQLKF